MTYNMFGETLNLALSVYLSVGSWCFLVDVFVCRHG